MKTTLLFLTTLISLQYVFGQSSSQVDNIIRREMTERKIPGLQVAIVSKGKIVLSKSYGIANVQDSVPVTEKSIFAINSCTKVFTAVAIMQLVEQGKLNLSTPVSAYLNDLPASWSGVTIKQLLTHTSGLPDELKLLDAKTGGLGNNTEASLWEKIKIVPLDFAAGEKFSYNQTNAYLLGKIINKLSGQTFQETFKKLQFEPANLKHTLFGDSRDVISHFAPTYFYRKNIDGQQLSSPKLVNNYYEFPYFRQTAAGLNSTATDLANWVIALQSGKLLTSKSSLDTMWSPGKFNNGKNTPWAMGWGMNKFRTKHKAVGMSGGGRSAFLIYPDDDLSVIVLTNLGGSYPEDFLEELAGCYNPDIPKADPITLMKVSLRKIGFDKAIPFAEAQKKNNPLFMPNEFEINEWGYRIMANGILKNAVEIFKLNTHLFPTSGNAFDSYGEALLKDGKKEEAIKAYQKSIALSPDNEHGKKVLETLLKP
ncbi:MAG: serine hydrolase [Pedobacter sp.]|uniref:serine hydrolase n=1 Tax=Pedobacter sp. TaxID=1411316 RepID=UPI002809E3B5|nr:serine hydrolase [Pedobacter sp.]MDQ8005899.1 serine hydrolase [Pedobacter sp.]